MPCINSTSAEERGGSLPLVEGGRILVGEPGAPGCTTTGVGSARCANADNVKNKAQTPAANDVPRHTASHGLGPYLCPHGGRAGLAEDGKVKSLMRTGIVSCLEM